MLRTIVDHAGGDGKGDMSEQSAWEQEPASSVAIRGRIAEEVEAILASLAVRGDQRRFDAVERELVGKVFGLGGLFLAFFLAFREERAAPRVARSKRRSECLTRSRSKIVGTFFGRVRYWRVQLRPASGKGRFPLDDSLGLSADGFSMLVMSLCARLATLVSFEQVTALLLEFLSWSPSKTTVEKAVLGFGRHASAWSEEAPAPQGDGEILVIQFDSKATPTATETELQKRRGKRDPKRRAPSPRHRGRDKRQRAGPKPRRKKGDKSKNGKATVTEEKSPVKSSDLFVQALENEGVEYVFGISGEENLDFLDSLSRSDRIRLILTRHEQAAGFMAATCGRLTGKGGLCLSTLGPGATNLVTAAAYAQLGGMPMLMMTGQKPIKQSKQGQFQIVDVVDTMRPLTKYTKQLVSGVNISSRVREAFRVAQEEKPGAVHLERPEDIAREELDEPLVQASFVRRPIAEEKSIAAAVERLERARHPLLLVGAGANRKLTCRMLRSLVSRFDIPFVTTQMGKGVLDERDPLCLGNTALSSGDFVHRALEAADLIVNIGHDVVEKPPFFMTAGGVEVIHVNFSTAAVDPVYFPQVEVVGDIANSIWQIGERLKRQAHWDLSRFLEVRGSAEAYLQKAERDNRFPIYPQRLVADVREVIREQGIIALDNGIYKIWFARNYKAHAPNTVLLDNALATMGPGLPSAIAAKLVHPDRQVMAICGDGGFMMNSQELETAVRLGLHIVTLILRNDAYGMIKWKQAAMGLKDFGLDYGNPDFVKYAESYGAIGHRVASSETLRSTLQAAYEEPGVHVIEVPVDYSDNDRILNHEMLDLSARL